MRKDTLLIVDEDENNLEHIINCVGNEYKILEASDGKEAIETLLKHKEYICALIINFSISELEQNTILSKIQQNNELMRIPVIIITDENQYERENMALQSGAWDFIRKPFDKEVMDLRLKNVIIRSNLNELQKLMYLEEFDKLTGIYNKNKFFKVTKKMIHNNKKGVYAFIHFDIDRFQSINSFLGKNEGDNLLKYIADYFTDTSKNFKEYTYGRIEADIFCMCISYEKEKLSSWLQNVRTKLTQYNLNFDIVPSIGIYIIEDNMLSIDRIYDRSTLAAKNSKNSYVNYYTFYDENMSKQIEKEQEIVNDMNTALNERQFSVYYQPKYDIKSNTLSGAEALVRWIHPIKGIVSPGEFIPIFEKNGFITKLDYYVWEEVCRQLRGWLDEGKKVYPISINVSRINLYNPRLVEMIIELTNKYNIPTNLFNLELTESAYIDNPLIMINSMMELQKKGFVILMDDFGSGYSSLSVLKDIAVDIIKIDMRFFSKTKIDGRGENIIASVIRMAKWLHIPVVAEGVETKEQVEFLRGIGCEYVQGFYYARPMPYDKYEELMDKGEALVDNDKNSSDNMDIDFLWSVSPQMEMLFNNAIQAVVICEFEDNHISILRVNKVYYEMMGYDENIFELDNAYNSIEKKYINDVLNAFNEAVNSKNTANCDYVHENKDGSYSWINMKVKYVNKVGDKSILCAVLIDITEQKKFEKEIQKYRSELLDDEENKKTMLIVDDVAQNRAILTEIFKNKFNIIEVENGLEAKNIIEKNPQCINIILLDLLMPVMDGKEFLAYKKSKKDIESIPVIIITAEDNPDMQRKVIEIGANDYIIKPFIPEIVALRVENVMQSAKSTKLMQEYKNDDIHRKVNFK